MTDNYRRIIDALTGKRRVLITTHVRPDGDALGSSAAMSMGLKARGIESQVVLLSHLPKKYSFIFLDHGISYFDVEKGWPESFDLDSYDALLIVDTGTWSQLPGMKERIEKWPKPKLVVDHHLTQEDWATEKLVVPQAAAAGEIVAELLDQWNVEIDKAMATSLYVAIASDTGWFQYSNTRPYTMRLAATLMERGADVQRIYDLLYRSERPQRLALHTRAMASLKLAANDTFGVMLLRAKDFEETGAAPTDTEGIVNLPLQIATVEVAALIYERGGEVRVSLRSKRRIDVSEFALRFGGGGHARAAAFSSKLSPDATCESLITNMQATLAATQPPREA